MKATQLAVALSVFVLFAVSGIALAQPFPGMPMPGQPGMGQPQEENMQMNAQFGMPQPGMMPGPQQGMMPGQMMPGQMPGQNMMPGAGGGTAIAATADFVYVVYGGALYQFTIDGLNLIKSVPLRPQGQRMRGQQGPGNVPGAYPGAGQQNRQQRQQRQQRQDGQVNPDNGNIQPEMD